jgi:hypothetical protein
MGTKLYGDPEVALRELIQNSIDACQLRAALEKKWGNEYKPKIIVKYFLENDNDCLEVSDNGTGMDQYIVDNYYSKIGSSYYTSSDFYGIKSEYNPDFIPRSRFGIGILSCFMVADTIITDTKRVKGHCSSYDPLNITIEGQDSIFLVKKGNRQTVGTDTILILRKKKHPWEKMIDDEFIDSVKRVVPNPPILIEIATDKKDEEIDEESFSHYTIDELKGSDWNEHENLRTIDININYQGLVGIARVGLLEQHNLPVSKVDVKSTDINIEGEIYTLEKEINLSTNEISLSSSSITINDDGGIKKTNFGSKIAESKSRVSLYGIEVPMSLFPHSWERQTGQAVLSWPFPMLLILDIGGNRELDLNSSRSQILNNEKWLNIEEDLAFEICSKIKRNVGADYWEKLLPIIQETKNGTFLEGLKKVNIEKHHA